MECCFLLSLSTQSTSQYKSNSPSDTHWGNSGLSISSWDTLRLWRGVAWARLHGRLRHTGVAVDEKLQPRFGGIKSVKVRTMWLGPLFPLQTQRQKNQCSDIQTCRQPTLPCKPPPPTLKTLADIGVVWDKAIDWICPLIWLLPAQHCCTKLYVRRYCFLTAGDDSLPLPEVLNGNGFTMTEAGPAERDDILERHASNFPVVITGSTWEINRKAVINIKQDTVAVQ